MDGSSETWSSAVYHYFCLITCSLTSPDHAHIPSFNNLLSLLDPSLSNYNIECIEHLLNVLDCDYIEYIGFIVDYIEYIVEYIDYIGYIVVYIEYIDLFYLLTV